MTSCGHGRQIYAICIASDRFSRAATQSSRDASRPILPHLRHRGAAVPALFPSEITSFFYDIGVRDWCAQSRFFSYFFALFSAIHPCEQSLFEYIYSIYNFLQYSGGRRPAVGYQERQPEVGGGSRPEAGRDRISRDTSRPILPHLRHKGTAVPALFPNEITSFFAISVSGIGVRDPGFFFDFFSIFFRAFFQIPGWDSRE